GLLLLLYTVVSMVQKVEESVNYVWQVERTRSLARRFSEYLSILLIAPVLMLLAITLRGAIASNTLTEKLLANELVSETALLATKGIPFAMVTTVFTFIYILVPNTRVRFGAALAGGLSASLLWNGVGAAFASFVAGSSSYTAIYTTFAAVIIALIWIYANWLILLVGAKISFYFQNPEYLRYGHRPVDLSHSEQERIAVEMMTVVARAFSRGESAHRINDLATKIGLPGRAIGPITTRLEQAGLLIITDNDLMLPGRSLDTIWLNDVLRAARGETSDISPYQRISKKVSAALEKMDTARQDTVSDVLLTDLMQTDDDAGIDVSNLESVTRDRH
ncbi:MAG: YihY/virulence factor BrkB family protein, partial [Gammaproteobacteria bacterium]